MGLWLRDADNAREAGIMEMWTRLTTNRLKVFKHLQDWFMEFRIYRRDEKGQVVKVNDHLMDATRYRLMRTNRLVSEAMGVYGSRRVPVYRGSV